MELRVLGIGDSVEVIEAEKCVANFVAGGEMFKDDDESETSDESNDFNQVSICIPDALTMDMSNSHQDCGTTINTGKFHSDLPYKDTGVTIFRTNWSNV